MGRCTRDEKRYFTPETINCISPLQRTYEWNSKSSREVAKRGRERAHTECSDKSKTFKIYESYTETLSQL